VVFCRCPRRGTAGKLRTWSRQSLINAVSAVRNTVMGLNKAEKIFSVPKTSLRRCVNMKNKTTEEVVQTKSGRKPVFSLEIEKELVDYLLFTETRLFGLARQDVRILAFQSATRSDLYRQFYH
jgi:hypothetical protein